MQQSYVARILCAAFAVATLCPVWAHGAEPADVLFSEVRWSGSPLSTADEWIEITNLSQETIDIGGWSIAGAGTQGALLIIPEDTPLAPYTTYLIANYAMGDAKSVLATAPQLVTTTLSLLNSDIALTLTDATGNTRDTWIDSGTPDAGSTSPYASAERDLATLAWVTATTSLHLTQRDTFGSPGFVLRPEITEEAPAVVQDESTILDAPPEEVIDDIAPEEVLVPETIPSEEDTSEDTTLIDTPPATEDIMEESEETIPDVSQNEDITPDDVFVEEIVIAIPVAENSTIITDAVVPEEHASTNDLEHSEVLSEVINEVTTNVANETTTQVIVSQNMDYAPLIVSEFVSDPSNGTEWVELLNTGEIALDLSAVTLADATGKTTALTGTLDAHAYTTINNPLGKLNNGGDALVLALTNGSTFFTLTYGTDTFSAPKKGFSAGLCAEGWRTDLAPTPGAENACPTSLPTSYESSTTDTDNGTDSSSGSASAIQGVTAETTSAQDTASSSHTQTASSVMDVTQAAQSASEDAVLSKQAMERWTPAYAGVTSELDLVSSGTVVEIEGVVTAAPGLFGKRIAYLNGLQLYFHKAEWPALTEGMRVRITGTWEHDADTRRVKISSAHDIVEQGTEAMTPAAPVLPLGNAQQDMLVTFTGTLTRKEDASFIFTLADGQEISVRDDAKTGALALAKQGDETTLTGIVLSKNGLWAIAPRTKDDVQFHAIVQEISQQNNSASITSSSSSSTTPLVGGGILASSVGALGYWLFRSQKLSFLFST